MLMKLAGGVALFAEEAPAGNANGGDLSSLLPSLLPFVAIFVLFYFLLIRPQRREQAKRVAMLSAIKKNDRVVTAGGIYGIVASVNREGDEVVVKVDETNNTKLRMTLSSVTRVLGDAPSDEKAN